MPAEVARNRVIVEAEAQPSKRAGLQQGAADGQRAIKQAEADGLLFVRRAEAEGLKARLLAEAEGAQAHPNQESSRFSRSIETCGGAPGAQNMLITEQLPSARPGAGQRNLEPQDRQGHGLGQR